MSILSIIIVNWNSKDYLSRCIDSIVKTVKSDYEIIVVDNNSSDGSVDMINEDYPNIKLLPQKSNHGFAKGNNVGIRYSVGENILLLNPDTILTNDAIDKMLQFMSSHKEIGILGPRILEEDGRVSIYCKRSLPTLWSEVAEIFLFNKLKKIIFDELALKFVSVKGLLNALYDESGSIECLQGSCMMIRRDVYDRLKGFDERVPMYLDDIDLCFRSRKKGYINYYLSDATIIHAGGYATKRAPNYMMYGVLGLYAHLIYYKKNIGLFCAFIYKIIVALSIPYLLLLDVITLPYYLIKNKLSNYMWVLRKHINYARIIFETHAKILGASGF